MSKKQDHDHTPTVEEHEIDKDLEKCEPGSSDEDDETIPSPSRPANAVAKEPNVSAVVAEESDDHFQRGRPGSNSSHESIDSQQTGHDVPDPQLPPHRPRSRAQSSTRSVRRDPVKVPAGQSQGLLARFALFAEITNPYDYPRRKKWIITAIVALAGIAGPMGASIILPGLTAIVHTFNSTPTVVNLSVAMYVLSMGIFPLWWSSFSETSGRRAIYLTSFSLFLIFNILAAVSPNIGMFVAMRVLAGGAAASVQTVGAGTIADVWEVKERGEAIGIFYLGPLCGPLISPIIGGLLVAGLGWRSTQWFLAILGGCLCLLILLFLPETLRRRKPLAAEAEQAAIDQTITEKSDQSRPPLQRAMTKQSVQIKTRKYVVMLRRAFIDPLHIILYLQFPAVAICVCYGSIVFASVYMLAISIESTFSKSPYNYSSIIVGLLYIPNSTGYFLSSVFGGRWVDRIMHREARKAGRYDDRGRLVFRPEDRMKENAWLGALMYPCALIMYGWSAQYGVNLAVPLVANFFFGVGSMIVFGLVTTMLTEYIPRKSSNGVAANNFLRNILACGATVAAAPMIDAIGDGWTFTIMGLAGLVGGIATICTMKKYGARWSVSMSEKMERVMGE